MPRLVLGVFSATCFDLRGRSGGAPKCCWRAVPEAMSESELPGSGLVDWTTCRPEPQVLVSGSSVFDEVPIDRGQAVLGQSAMQRSPLSSSGRQS